MADNTTLNSGSGGDVVRTNDRSSVKTPVVMLDLGSDSAESVVDGTAAAPAALMPTGQKVVRVTQTPTITAGAYGAGDAVGGLLTFANSARVSGGSIIIEGVTIVDADAEQAVLELVLFDQTFTNTADNSPFDPSDADLANVIAVVPISTYYNFTDNAVASRFGLGLACKLAGTSLFGQLVTRGTPTYAATSDITVILHIVQN